ncbi:MAG: hydroxymethylglutaryl-CoA synthase [Candidatus Syntropharchaeia archaeon]
MEVGIIGYGAYIPRYRISREEYIKAWESFSAPGIKEKSCPGYDEDVITMGIEAGMNAIARAEIDPDEIEMLCLGTTSAPYTEKFASSTIAASISSNKNINISDFSASTKAGTAAMIACLNAVIAGKKYALSIASDAPVGRPDDEFEHPFGAAASAFLIGKEDVIAEIEGYDSFATETYGERFRKLGEKESEDLGLGVAQDIFSEAMSSAIEGLMKELNLKPEDFDKVVTQKPDGRSYTRALRKFKFSKEQLSNGIVEFTGDTGASSALLSLAHVLDNAKGGERILVVSYGSGASDAISIVVKENIKEKKGLAPTVKEYLENKELIDYVKYLRFKRVLSMSFQR